MSAGAQVARAVRVRVDAVGQVEIRLVAAAGRRLPPVRAARSFICDYAPEVKIAALQSVSSWDLHSSLSVKDPNMVVRIFLYAL